MKLCMKFLPKPKYPGAFVPLFDILLQLNTVRTYISTTTYTWCYSCQLLHVNEGLCRSCCPPLNSSSHAVGTVYTQTSLSREPTNHTTVGPLPQDTGTVQYTAHTYLVCQVIKRGLTVLLGIVINYTVVTYTHIHNIRTYIHSVRGGRYTGM